MHAVFVVSQIDDARAAEAEAMLKEGFVPRIKQAPGFVTGTWTRTGSDARSMIVFESEETARATLASVTQGLPDGAPVSIVDVAVLEVLVQA